MEWISIKERLPDNEGEVVIAWESFPITLEDGCKGMSSTRFYKNGQWIECSEWFDWGEYVDQADITHWTPLPEEPPPESDDIDMT